MDSKHLQPIVEIKTDRTTAPPEVKDIASVLATYYNTTPDKISFYINKEDTIFDIAKRMVIEQ